MQPKNNLIINHKEKKLVFFTCFSALSYLLFTNYFLVTTKIGDFFSPEKMNKSKSDVTAACRAEKSVSESC